MSIQPEIKSLVKALEEASTLHHEYETTALNGAQDEQWAGWYAAYVLGRLGEFTSPSQLAQWLQSVTNYGKWSETAAIYILEELRKQ